MRDALRRSPLPRYSYAFFQPDMSIISCLSTGNKRSGLDNRERLRMNVRPCLGVSSLPSNIPPDRLSESETAHQRGVGHCFDDCIDIRCHADFCEEDKHERRYTLESNTPISRLLGSTYAMAQLYFTVQIPLTRVDPSISVNATVVVSGIFTMMLLIKRHVSVISPLFMLRGR